MVNSARGSLINPYGTSSDHAQLNDSTDTNGWQSIVNAIGNSAYWATPPLSSRGTIGGGTSVAPKS